MRSAVKENFRIRMHHTYYSALFLRSLNLHSANTHMIKVSTALVVLASTALALQRPFRSNRVFVETSDPASSGTANSVTDRSVKGMCSSAQDSLGRLVPASQSGISTLMQCAQYGKEHSGKAVFVTFSRSENSCMWFSDCECLVTSSACLGGDQWASIAIEDTIQNKASSVQTTDAPKANSAVIKESATTAARQPQTAAAESTAECDKTSTDLMQFFQSKCEMSHNIWVSRLTAIAILGVFLVILGSSFGVAYHLDNQELAALAANRK